MYPSESFAAAGQRVLVCEDEGLTALRLRKTLISLAYQVVGEARNGEEAVVLARTLRPDVILMDINMPVLDGIGAALQIMRECPTPIVMLTAYSEHDVVERALEAGASGYLVKPVQEDQLRPALLMARSQFAEWRRSRRAATELEAANQELRSVSETDRLLLREAEQQAREAKERARDLGRQLQQEREVARVLAESFVTGPPQLPGLDIGFCYEPASEVASIGGDFLDFIEVGDHRLGLVVGDLCGHGLEAATHVARAKYMLRAYAAEEPAPASVVSRLNRALCQSMTADCPFLTLFYGVLDLDTMTLSYCNAGHPAPLLHHPAWHECRSLELTGGLVGAVPELNYTQGSIVLEPGAILTLFTDGVIEARSNGEMLEHSGVCAVLRRSATEGASTIAAAILDRALTFADGQLMDDVAIAVFKRLARDA